MYVTGISYGLWVLRWELTVRGEAVLILKISRKKVDFTSVRPKARPVHFP